MDNVKKYQFQINRTYDSIYVTTHTAQGELVELVHFQEGHLAIVNYWSDDKIRQYLADKFDARSLTRS